MSDIITKDMWSYPNSTTLNNDIEFLVARNLGGGSYALYNMTKEHLFKLQGIGLTIVPSIGVNDLVAIDGTSFGFKYINPGVGMAQFNQFIVSPNGSTAAAQMTSGGVIIAGNASAGINGSYQQTYGSFTMTLQRILTENITSEPMITRDQRIGIVSPSNAGTTAITNDFIRTTFFDVAAPLLVYTIEFPSDPRDNQIIKLVFNGQIGNITMDGDTKTIESPITSTSPGFTSVEWQFNAADDTWYPIAQPVEQVGATTLTTHVMVNAGAENIENSFNSTTIITPGSGSVFTLTLPENPVDAQTAKIVIKTGVSSFILNENDGSTIDNNPSGSVSANDSFEYQYEASSTTWWRIR